MKESYHICYTSHDEVMFRDREDHGMTQATILSVPTLVYAPFCVFNVLSPLMSILMAILGWKIRRKQWTPEAVDAGKAPQAALPPAAG